ncbi:MAG: RagB/SusD family nutrient uptake outer membrane protein [Bacteroidales bacterium]|nr:RagB/SusD family nutrient uptake outer membrane protein [Bacteroidales bacterium]
MKKIFNIFAIAAVGISLASCESFLDTTNYWSRTNDNFPTTEDDADQMLAGIYNNLNISIGNNVHKNHFLWANASADDMLGGGANNDQAFQAEDLLLNFQSDMYNTFYVDRYKGVSAANLAIASFPNCPLSEDKVARSLGEAYFLRAYYMYELASMFGNIPYPLSSTPNPTEPQVSGTVLWGQILADLRMSIDTFPDGTPQKGTGHVDKYTAEALLGRVYLFASDFYGATSFEGKNGESTITVDKTYVQEKIKDCVNNSGYSLVSDYHNLWSYTNRCTVEDKLSPWAGQGYVYAQNDSNVNPEAMFIIKFNTQPSWSTTIGYSNQTALFLGVRNQGNPHETGDTFPFGTGWGMCPVNPTFVEEWIAAEPKDARRDASVVDAVKTWPNYKISVGDSFIQESLYYQTKNMPVLARDTQGKCPSTFWVTYVNEMYPGITWVGDDSNNFQLGCITDMIMIRFAEVLLIDAEINGNAESLNKVRARAGLPEVPCTKENIIQERRWELAFEGIRFNDIRRMGEAYAVRALDKQSDAIVYNDGVQGPNVPTTGYIGYGARYSATKGFVTIPESQIALSAGAGEQYRYVQNEGWGNDAQYAGWH